MLLLTTTTDLLQLVTGAAYSTDIVASFVDITATGFTPGSSQANVATATTTTVVASPAAGVQRQLKMLSIRNSNASNNQTVTLQKSSSSTAYNVTGAIVLQPGETLYYQDGVGFSVRDALGQIKQTNGAFATPTALVGLAAVAGSATSGIRSDGAPALDQSIGPTWTGQHKFTQPVLASLSLQVTGSSATGYGTSGGLEFSYSGGGGNFNSYNRGTSSFTPLTIGSLYTQHSGNLQVTGGSSLSATGSGVEIDYIGGGGFVISYNRTANSYPSLALNASTLPTNTLGTGTVYSNAGTFTNTNPSDAKLKKDVIALNYGLKEICALRPVSYRWIDEHPESAHRQFGFLAQEVQPVMPDAVREFTTGKGKTTRTQLGLDKEAIYGALVFAVQEIAHRLDSLESTSHG